MIRLLSASLAALLLLGACSGPGIKKQTFDPYAASKATSADVVKTGTLGTLEPSMLKPPNVPFTIGPGDVLDIDLMGSTEGPQQTFVGPDGKIYFHLLPGQQVWGLTVPQTQALLERGLSQYVRNPHIGITLREVHSRRVWVLGRINTPGLYELNSPMTILEAISKAGGLFTSRMSGSAEELADLQHSFIIRRDKLIPVDFNKLIRQGDTSQNIYLEADDFIYLPSALGSEIYVLGAVGRSHPVAFKDEVSLVTALAQCQGLAKGAIANKVAIVRGSLHEPSIAIVDAQAILEGKKPDILLQPKDIVYVPQSSPGSLSSYASLIVNSFVRIIAANEGAAAGGANAPVPVNISLGQ
jgi:protein involved in polysaccharide export with SLBB domain